MYIALRNKIVKSIVLVAVCIFFSFQINTSLDLKTVSKTKFFDLSQNTTRYLYEFIPENKISVIVFHSVFCPFNTINQTKIDASRIDFQNDSISFIYVNCNPFENKPKNINPEVSKFVTKCQCTYILDESKIIENLFQVDKNSTLIVCKRLKNNALELFYEGSIDENPQSKSNENLLNEAIKNALTGEKTPFTSVETGCRILNH